MSGIHTGAPWWLSPPVHIQSSPLPAASRSTSPPRSTARPRGPRGAPLLNQQRPPWRHQAEAGPALLPKCSGARLRRWGFLLLQGKKLQKNRSSQKARDAKLRVLGPPRKQRPARSRGMSVSHRSGSGPKERGGDKAARWQQDPEPHGRPPAPLPGSVPGHLGAQHAGPPPVPPERTHGWSLPPPTSEADS